MTDPGGPSGTIDRVLGDAERELAEGRPEEARRILDLIRDAELTGAELTRYAEVLWRANRFLNQHAATVTWIDGRLGRATSPGDRARLLRSRLAALRQVDPNAVLLSIDEALDAARAAGDDEVLAAVLCHAAFAAYRRGDARLAARFADEAAIGEFTTARGQIEALRAQMFAATAAGAIERALELSATTLDRLLEIGDVAGAANECNNCAEGHLQLGQPEQAEALARRAGELAARSGHRGVEQFASVLAARAAAEAGRLDDGIDGLRAAEQADTNLIFALDTAAALSFWLVERGGGHDLDAAEEVTSRAIERARDGGVRHLLTALHAARARSRAARGDAGGARDELTAARKAADAADRDAELQLALTMATVLPAGDPPRETALRGARASLLRASGRRENPWRFCACVRLHRRLLELSGGVPGDLPAG